MLDNRQDIESVIDYIKEFIDKDVGEMLELSEFERGGYAMCYKLIDGLERLMENGEDDS